jgi:uncharacterized protein YoxC
MFTRLFSKPLAELDRLHESVQRHEEHVSELRSQVAGLCRENRTLRAEMHRLWKEVTTRQDEFDAAFDPVRRFVTSRRDLPDERTFDAFALAGRYTQLIDNDVADIADRARQREPADSTVDPLRREADLAHSAAQALLTGDAADEAAVLHLLGPDASPDDRRLVAGAVHAATELRADLAELGATLDWGGATGSGRLWPGCSPGPVALVVAPALVIRGTVVAEPGGRPAGPWYFTDPARSPQATSRPTRASARHGAVDGPE